MEQETVVKSRVWINILIGTGAFFLAFVIYYTIMSVAASSKKVKETEELYGYKQDGKTVIDERILSDSTFLRQMKTKSFLQSRISMAETDSVYITIDLADTTVNLEISGVIVHRTHITEYEMSKMLRTGNEYVLLNMMSKPFSIVSDFSSIEKEPLMIKMAPKDTSEFQPDIMPDTADFEPVNYILNLDNGIKVYVYQDENLNKSDARHRFFFDLDDRLRTFSAAFRKIIRFRVPDYNPSIKLRLPREDAKILYRAIPVNGQIAVNK